VGTYGTCFFFLFLEKKCVFFLYFIGQALVVIPTGRQVCFSVVKKVLHGLIRETLNSLMISDIRWQIQGLLALTGNNPLKLQRL